MTFRPVSKPGAAPGTTSPEFAVDWRAKRLCSLENAELFFAPEGERGNATREREAAAKAICQACPVQLQCLRDAIENGLEGIWGGTSDDERENSRRARSNRLIDSRKPPKRRGGCGTPNGSRNHYKHHEQACEDCLTARREADRAERADRPPGHVVAAAVRAAQVAEARAEFVAQVEDFVRCGFDVERAAAATGRRVAVFERYLQRLGRHDLIASLKQRSAA